MLERRGIEPPAAAAAVEEVTAAGYLDDADFARRFAEDRRRLDRWGAERIARELDRRGVGADLVAETLAGQSGEDELEAACALLADRLGSAPLADDRVRDRALGLLVRRGYESEVAYGAVRRHERAHGAPAG